MKKVFRGLLTVAAIVALTASAASAQGRGSIFGKATDSSGGVMPGVTVTVSGDALQQPLVQVTAGSGAYQFPTVPIGSFTVTFELSGFKKVTRTGIVITNGFNAPVDVAMEVGSLTEEVTVSAAAPVVDTKKTTTGATFTSEILEKIPTARDPWQIINMTPGVQAGLNVGGSSSGQQVGLESRGTTSNVQWNLEGGSITDMASNSSPMYFNFDSFEQIAVTNGGGDVSVQTSGLSINLVTKSGSNVFKGSTVGTFENASMQSTNVDEDLFNRGTGGFLSGQPIKKIYNISGEFGGPILRNRLWWWAAADRQDINKGVLNFFDPSFGSDCSAFAEAQRTGVLGSLVTFNDLSKVQDCLANDQTIIKNYQVKLNYQLNASHKFQALLSSDVKTRNARGASATTAQEATTQQYSPDPWGGFIPALTTSFTHTWIASDRLVFNNQFTYVHGGFSLDYQDFKTCGESLYLGSEDFNAYLQGPRASESCLWNQQQLSLRTTGFRSRSLASMYNSTRRSTELKTEGTYFLTNVMGGDHSLKFGGGYRKNPQQSFRHYSGGARARMQCVGNSSANCGTALPVAVGSATGLVPYLAELYRDRLTSNKWWTYNAYIQDSYSVGRLRVNAGLRYDWQQSSYLGGCVPANIIRPDLLPSQCDAAATADPITGRELQSYSNFSPRASLTYDLKGDGKTSLRLSGSYYYQAKIVLANNFGGLSTLARLRWTSNATSGACRSSSCWNDANVDSVVQANELMGIPSVSNSARFNTTTGVLSPAGNTVDPSAQLQRTREVTAGISHELIPNLAIGVDGILRQYDRGITNYTIGYEPGAAGFPMSQIYTGPLVHTDPATGQSGNYYAVKDTAFRPSGIGSIALTDLDVENYKGVDITMNKRYADKWQANVALTLQTSKWVYAEGSNNFNNPTGKEYISDINNVSSYVFKVNGSYDLPYGITASTNFNWNQGGRRIVTIDGPEDVPGGLGSNGTGGPTLMSYGSIRYQSDDTVRYDPLKLLDLGLQKTFTFSGGQNRIKVMFDAFNVMNNNSVRSFSSNLLSSSVFTRVSSIVPPRVFRIGAQINF